MAGMDWILHADLAGEADLDAVAEAGCRLMPTATFLWRAVEMGQEFGRTQNEIDNIRRHAEGTARVIQRSRELGIKILCGTDSGNSTPMPYGELHANEAELLVKYGGYTSMEAIQAITRETAYVMGLEGELGTLEEGKLADIIMLDADPLADISVLQGGQHLTSVMKDGKMVDLSPSSDSHLPFQQVGF